MKSQRVTRRDAIRAVEQLALTLQMALAYGEPEPPRKPVQTARLVVAQMRRAG